MAGGVNKAILIGNLGQDPTVRYTQSGAAVCNLRIAVTERKKEGDEWTDHTEWVDIVTFGKNAENAGQYLAKGRQIYVEGRLQTRKWKDKEGNDRYSTEVVAQRIVFLSGGGQDGGGRDEPKPRGRGRGGRSPTRGATEDDGKGGVADDGFYDDDLPF